jgi:hypothetical protein
MWTSLTKANLVIHLPTILSWMPLAKVNLVIHFPAILSRVLLAKANFINTLDFFIYQNVSI